MAKTVLGKRRYTVDFRLMDVSVVGGNRVTSTTPIKKPLTVLAILIFGAFTVSFASASTSDGPLYAASADHAPREGLLNSDAFTQRLAVICLGGDVPRSTQPNFHAYRINPFRVVDPVCSAVFLENYVPKVSLHILQSVLLI